MAALLANPGTGTDVAAIRAYVDEAVNRADVDRMADAKEKTGVASGLHAINPATDQPIPIWIADYVLMGYGTGAIMAVPGQDERDWAFAETFDLPIVRTVQPPASFDGKAYVGDGPAMNSGFLDGMEVVEAKRTIIDWLEKHGRGRARVQYKLRDWLFSRQRYWGEPFPVVYDEQGRHYAVGEATLPVALPAMTDYHPIESDEPAPLLAKATEWLHTTAGQAGVDPALLSPETPVTRETNTMPGWAGSCWYYLRYCAPRSADRFVDRSVEQYWMLSGKGGADVDAEAGYVPDAHHVGGVDLYIGGAEHAVLHLLYARFWHKLLFDLGEVSTPEPFGRLFHQGLILSYAYQRPDRSLIPNDEVVSCFIEDDQLVWRDHAEQVIEAPSFEISPEGEAKIKELGRTEGAHFITATGEPVARIVAKMSKSLKNVVNPDDIIQEYGADTFRLYEMYLGPLESSKPWNTHDIIGPFRFLQRTWRLVVDEDSGELRCIDTPNPEVERRLHATIAKVESDIERLAFNTAIAAMIEFVNEANKAGGLTADQLTRFTIVLAPFVPHIASELWHRLGRTDELADAPWPTHDPALLAADEIEMPVQILGKVRSKITVAAEADAATVEAAALADPRIADLIADKTVRKVIVVPGKIVNIIVG
ncbi:MAG: class I tRNA ligase family protein [Planctomycetota bacterium]